MLHAAPSMPNKIGFRDFGSLCCHVWYIGDAAVGVNYNSRMGSGEWCRRRSGWILAKARGCEGWGSSEHVIQNERKNNNKRLALRFPRAKRKRKRERGGGVVYGGVLTRCGRPCLDCADGKLDCPRIMIAVFCVSSVPLEHFATDLLQVCYRFTLKGRSFLHAGAPQWHGRLLAANANGGWLHAPPVSECPLP